MKCRDNKNQHRMRRGDFSLREKKKKGGKGGKAEALKKSRWPLLVQGAVMPWGGGKGGGGCEVERQGEQKTPLY